MINIENKQDGPGRLEGEKKRPFPTFSLALRPVDMVCHDWLASSRYEGRLYTKLCQDGFRAWPSLNCKIMFDLFLNNFLQLKVVN